MKRDLKINYGILDQIIEQLHTYKRALHQMQTSLHTIAGYTERNAGKSLEAWEELMQQSKKNIQSYQTQIEDLLTLFENYVADTTAYITPISRNSMMRVDRNDIWGNLTQIEWGVTYRLSRAIQETYRSPSLLFSLFDDTDLEERERSRYNKQQLESIRNDMESVQSKLKNKMEELWDLYESKVKKYENTDDEYANKASRVKDRYTTFSERVSDVISVTAEGAWDFVKGHAVAIYEIAKGLITLVIDAGIVAASGIIPDSIEPDFLKKASTKRIESATETLDAIIYDPVIVLESMAQSITDTAEKEGIMYVSGSAATSFLPYVGQAKYLKLLKGEKSKNKANEIRSAISQKTTKSLQRIDGSKKENSLWPNGIKNSGKQYVQEVTHFFRQTFMPHPSFQLSTANQVPVNVWSRATIENRMDSIVPVSLRKVEGKGTAKGTGKDTPAAFRQTEFASSYEERLNQTPSLINQKVGFEGTRGESKCTLKPPPDPQLKKILNEAGVDGIQYKNAVPDFSPVAKAEFDIDYMLGGNGNRGTNARRANFAQADQKLADQLNSSPNLARNFGMKAGGIKARDIERYRERNKLTWHELNDVKTIQLVPSKINKTFGHLGGVGEINAGAFEPGGFAKK